MAELAVLAIINRLNDHDMFIMVQFINRWENALLMV